MSLNNQQEPPSPKVGRNEASLRQRSLFMDEIIESFHIPIVRSRVGAHLGLPVVNPTG